MVLVLFLVWVGSLSLGVNKSVCSITVEQQVEAVQGFVRSLECLQSHEALCQGVVGAEYIHTILPGLEVVQIHEGGEDHLRYRSVDGKLVVGEVVKDKPFDVLVRMSPEMPIVFDEADGICYGGCWEGVRLAMTFVIGVAGCDAVQLVSSLTWLISEVGMQLQRMGGDSMEAARVVTTGVGRYSRIMAVEIDLDGRWRRIPDSLCEILGYSEAELEMLQIDQISYQDGNRSIRDQCQKLINREIDSFHAVKQSRHKLGHSVWIESTYTLQVDEADEAIGILVYMHDVTHHKRLQAISIGQDAVLKQLAYGSDLDGLLKVLVRNIQNHMKGVFGCFVLLDTLGKKVDRVVSVHLPEDELKGCFPGEVCADGSCAICRVLATKRRFMADNIMVDPHCKSLVAIASRLGFRSCVVEPVLGDKDRLKGVFFLFYIDQRNVTIDEFKLIMNATNLAAIAIRHRDSQESQNFHTQLEQLITSHSNKFLGVKPSQLKTEITRSLETIGRFVGADRAFLYRYTKNNRKMRCTNEWVADGFEAYRSLHLERDQDGHDWEMACLAGGNVLYVPDPLSVPLEMKAQERYFGDRNCQSMMIIPLIINHRTRGFVGFITVKETRAWSEEIIALSRVYSEILASAIGRNIQEKKLYDRTLRLSLALKATNLGIWDADFKNNRYYKNTEWAGMLGYTLAEIEPIRNAWERLTHPDDYKVASEAYHAHINGETDCFEAIHRMKTKDGSWRWIQSRGDVVQRDENGIATRVTGTHLDVHEIIAAQEEQAKAGERYKLLSGKLQVLLSELDHRVKNNLGALDALVRTYSAKYDEVDEFADAMRGKIMAMKAVHDIMAQSERQSVNLEGILNQLVAQVTQFCEYPIGVDLEGPYTNISSRQASAVAMTFQELFTNALKYGAHSNADGVVRISWEIVDQNTEMSLVRIHWQESGGPVVSVPEKFGIGLDLIKGFCRFELTGECEYIFNPEGFECVITCRLDQELKVQTVPAPRVGEGLSVPFKGIERSAEV